MIKPKKSKVKKEKEPDILKQIAKYLETHGWKVVVIGGTRVQQQFGAYRFNYEFVVNFTGAKKGPEQKP